MPNGMQKLLIGIGNPGEEYRYTRHNVGFLTVESFVNHFHQKFERNSKLKSLVASFFIEESKIIVIKPLTFVNLSGEAVLAVMNYHKISRENILVISDDVNLSLGNIRLRTQGSSGGHNGLKNIIEKLGSSGYPRLRIGIGNVDAERLSKYVLSEFSIDERIRLNVVIEKTIPFLASWVTCSFQEIELIFSRLQEQNNF